jgi:hypothetical protein
MTVIELINKLLHLPPEYTVKSPVYDGEDPDDIIVYDDSKTILIV